jgi:hypothetical protein
MQPLLPTSTAGNRPFVPDAAAPAPRIAEPFPLTRKKTPMPKWLTVRNVIVALSFLLNLLGGTKTIDAPIDLPALISK